MCGAITREALQLLELDCGIPKARLSAWLDDELGLPGKDGTWVFTAEGSTCRVALAPLESRSLGSVSIERTALTIEGEEPAQGTFMRLFTLRFASAGG